MYIIWAFFEHQIPVLLLLGSRGDEQEWQCQNLESGVDFGSTLEWRTILASLDNSLHMFRIQTNKYPIKNNELWDLLAQLLILLKAKHLTSKTIGSRLRV